MSVKYQITANEEFNGATIYLGGETYTVDPSNPFYEEIIVHLVSRKDDDEALLAMVRPAEAVALSMGALSERVALRNGVIYFDGDELDNSIAEVIIRTITEGEEWAPLVNFLEKLYTNPSETSRQHLYHFMGKHQLTICEDGDFIAYKGVGQDGRSSNRGYGIVNGEVFENEHLDNSVGNVVEIPRSMVDTNRGVACSTGLHAGSYGYASTFAAKLLTVKINPRDVVSVPSDSNDAKLRVSRYRVVENNTKGEYTTTVFREEPVAVAVAVAVEPVESEAKLAPHQKYREYLDSASPFERDLSYTAWYTQHYGVFPRPDDKGPDVNGALASEPDEDDKVMTKVAEVLNEMADALEAEQQSPTPDPKVEAALAEIEGDDDPDLAVLAEWHRRVDAMKALIPTLVTDGVKLRRYRNKKITAKNRPAFTEAARQLGVEL